MSLRRSLRPLFAAVLPLALLLAAPVTAHDAVDQLTNQVRIEHGLPAVSSSGQIAEIAARRAAEASVVWDHRDLSPDLAGACWTWWGENLHWFSPADAWTAEISVQAWLGSNHHRANMLYPTWDVMGSGTFTTADGRIFVAQIFVDLCEQAGTKSTPSAKEPSAPSVATPDRTPAIVLPDTAMSAKDRGVTWFLAALALFGALGAGVYQIADYERRLAWCRGCMQCQAKEREWRRQRAGRVDSPWCLEHRQQQDECWGKHQREK